MIDYPYRDQEPTCAAAYLWPVVENVLGQLPIEKRLFEVGCGNGAFLAHLKSLGWQVAGTDGSQEGIAQARQQAEALDVAVADIYEDLAAKFGHHRCVVMLEVIEHLLLPGKALARIREMMLPGGYLVLSTPYHGYWKNLALAVTGKFDNHFTALWDYGHIKFFSIRTLSALLAQHGFTVAKVMRVGRIPPLAKSMILLCQAR